MYAIEERKAEILRYRISLCREGVDEWWW